METINNTKTLESLPMNNQVAVSSPVEIDYHTCVSNCATRKAKIGETFAGKKGKQGLFSLTCAMVKSLLGMGKLDHLPSDIAAKINEAVENFWKLQANKVLSYGEVVSATFDKPVIRFNNEMVVESIQGQATMTARRDAKSTSESLLWLSYALTTAKKRMDYMLDHPAKYNRAELQTQQAKLAGIENKIAEIEKSRNEEKNKAIYQ